MRFGPSFTGMAILCISLPCFAVSHARRGPTSPHLFQKRSSRSSSRPASQRVIDDSRAAQIQTALAGAGYLSGEPSGHWDAGTESAMQRFQSDNGWQTKLMPDSRAIIKLGLGPSQQTSPRFVDTKDRGDLGAAADASSIPASAIR